MAAAPPESWTDQRVNQLKKLWTQGKSASEIADQLGGVTRNAVIGKAHRLGLSGRPSPIKKAPSVKKPAAPVAKAAPKPPMKTAMSTAKPAAPQALAKPAAKAVPAGKMADAKPAVPPAAPNKAPVATAKPSTNNATPVKASPFNQPLTPEVMARPLMVHDGKVISILELTEKTCRWPIGDPKDPAFGYCGLTVHPNFPYCPGHVVMAFQSSRKDNRKVVTDAKADTGTADDIDVEDIEVAEDEEDLDADALDDDADEGDDLAV